MLKGGIAVIWNPTEFITDWWIGFPKILTRKFRLIGQSEWFLVSAVYGPHTPVDGGSFLTHMQKLGNMHQEQMWIIAGDFNMTTSKEEKKEGIQREDPEMERFKDLKMELRLVDSPTINGKFT